MVDGNATLGGPSNVMLGQVIYGAVTVHDILTAGFILFASYIIAKALPIYIRRTFKDRVRQDHIDIVVKVVYYGILGFACIAVLPYLGIDPSSVLVAGGIAGFVIGFASQSIVGNLISGLFLFFERPIRIGNQVNIGGITGYVEDIHTISTVIRTYDGLYVRIPNEKVFTNNITNYVHNLARRFDYSVGIRYSDDADKAIAIIEGLIKDHPLALVNPAPLVFVKELGDNAVIIDVKVWAPASEWYGVRMGLLWKIKKALEDEGIEIAFPQRVVWMAGATPPSSS